MINFLENINDINCLINDWQKKNISFLFLKEKRKEVALLNLNYSLISLGGDILTYIQSDINNKKLQFKCNKPVLFSYYFNEEKNDMVETTTNLNLIFFIKNKLCSINSFVDYCIKNKINKEILLPDRGDIVQIIHSFCFFPKEYSSSSYYYKNDFLNIKIENINLKIPEKLLFDKNVISSYLNKTSQNILEPNYSNLIASHTKDLKRLYYDNIYPIIIFNCNISEYFNYFTLYDKKQNKLKNAKVDYKNYVDFSELINSINNTQFHNDKKLNSLFHVRAINYIINSENSLIFIFLNLLFDIISKNYLSKVNLKKIKFKIKVINKTEEKNIKPKKVIDDKLVSLKDYRPH